MPESRREFLKMSAAAATSPALAAYIAEAPISAELGGTALLSDVEFDDIKINLARENFGLFRREIRQGMLWGWWTQEIAWQLQRFYNEMVEGKRPKLAISSPPQHGKLVADDTPVLTADGWRRHGDLKVGDRVYHPSGWPTRVLAISEKAPANHRVELTNGEVIYCHGCHEWTVHNGHKYRRSLETIETRDLLVRPLLAGEQGKRGCRYIYQLPLVEPLHGEEKLLPVDPYALGVWLGDGKSTGAQITYGVVDREIVWAVAACGYDVGATWETPKGSGVFTTHFHGLRSQLREAGVLAESCGVRTKHVPDIYFTASVHSDLSFLLGSSILTDTSIQRMAGLL